MQENKEEQKNYKVLSVFAPPDVQGPRAGRGGCGNVRPRSANARR